MDRYQEAFLSSPDGILIVDEEGRIQDLNPQIETLFRYERSDLIGERVEKLIPDRFRDRHAKHRKHYGREPGPRPMGVGLELWGARSDGSAFPVEISLSPMSTDRGLSVIATVRNVSERRRLQVFGTGTLRATEDERRRIARELHDDTAQNLAVLLLRLRLATRSSDPASWRSELIRLRSDITDIAEGVRRIARGLRPPALEDAGLVAAIRAHIRTVFEKVPIELELETTSVDGLLTSEGKLVLYRIVQESISNTLRHAQASKLSIRILIEDDQVIGEIADDGVGFQLNRPSSDGSGLGLIGMTERASLVSGRVTVDSSPGKGTRVRVSIPINGDEETDG